MSILQSKSTTYIFFICLSSSHIYADEIILSSGEIFHGSFTQCTNEKCTFQTNHGVIHVRKDEIKNIGISPLPVPDKKLKKVSGKNTTSRKLSKQSLILLGEGESSNNFDISISNNEGFSGIKEDSIRSSYSYRYGISNNLELSLNIPFYQIKQKDLLTNDTTSISGLGNVSLGLSKKIDSWSTSNREVVSNITIKLPSGKSKQQNTQHLNVVDNDIETSIGLSVVKISSPLTLYANADYTHFFNVEHETYHKKGGIFSYNAGIGFYINKEISLNAQLNGFYAKPIIKSNGIKIDHTTPISMRMGGQYRISKNTLINPFVNYGLNDDANDVEIGLSFDHYY
jgi:hypothetical protein